MHQGHNRKFKSYFSVGSTFYAVYVECDYASGLYSIKYRLLFHYTANFLLLKCMFYMLDHFLIRKFTIQSLSKTNESCHWHEIRFCTTYLNWTCTASKENEGIGDNVFKNTLKTLIALCVRISDLCRSFSLI